MQKFSGIYMGRRRKQAGEPEADMEGSGEDNEPQVLSKLGTGTTSVYRFIGYIGHTLAGKPGDST
jgi:hypothetical protein